MSLQEQKDFYDIESGQYSRKRYEGPLTTYTQFVFRRRRDIFIAYMNLILQEKKEVSVFEIGCADGILLRTLKQRYGSRMSKMVGVDVSSSMIYEARQQTKNPDISFAMRGEEAAESYDIVVELGVHVINLQNEMDYVKSHLAPAGFFIFSAAGKDSLHTKIKLKEADYARDYRSYDEIEADLKSNYDIIAAEPYGLFIPKLWAIPALGRILLPIAEAIMKYLAPSLFHEKIYFLRNKSY